MTIRTNMGALYAHRNLNINQKHMNKALQRLSSGYRINSAADDAAGLAISEKMRGQIRGLTMASRNAQNAISMLQTAEGGLNEVHAILQRMRELAVQASNGTYDNDVDRANLDKEYQALMEEINRIASYTNYNGIGLLNGSTGGTVGTAGVKNLGIDTITSTSIGMTGEAKLDIVRNSDGTVTFTLQTLTETTSQTVAATDTGVTLTFADGSNVAITFDTNAAALTEGYISRLSLASGNSITNKTISSSITDKAMFQIGANGTADQRTGVHIPDMSTALLGTDDLKLWMTSIANPNDANAAIAAIEAATNQVSSVRGDIGAQISRLEHTINSLENTIENLTAAESAIRDADMAEEMMNYVKYSILVQAAQAMLAQAMQQPNYILQLLGSL